MLLSELCDRLSARYHFILPQKEHVDAFADKARFRVVAEKHGFPVPRTFRPESEEALLEILDVLRYPVVVKPTNPQGWEDKAVLTAVGYKKAIRLDTRGELLTLYLLIAPMDPDMLVQEYIHGPDEAHFDIHIYMDRESNPVAFFTGQKIRNFPAYAGSGVTSRALWSIPSSAPVSRCSRRWDIAVWPTSTTNATARTASSC
jgi:predicted ATP-grasp superfamily ATP-dependent carboligase